MAENALMTQLVNDAIVWTKRPDLRAQTVLAVKAATRKAHLSELFNKDIVETGVSFDSALYIQQFNVKELFPLFRQVAAIRKVSFDNGTNSWKAGAYFDEQHITNMLDSYKVPKTEVFYLAGDNLNIRSSTAEQQILFSAYMYPETSEEKYKSWIASEIPEVIYYEAAALVFKGIGYDEQMAMMRDSVATWMLELRNSNLFATGG